VNDGYAIDIRATVDGSIGNADLARVATMDLEVSGDEAYSKKIAVSGKLSTSSRSAGVRYRPLATRGTITISIYLYDAADVFLGSGHIGPIGLIAGKTQVVNVTIAKSGAMPPMAGASCGNGILDAGELCDPGPGSATPCPGGASDCDDGNSCTTDTVEGSSCQAHCVHAAVGDTNSCTAGATGGVCLGGSCCTGCIQNGVCRPGSESTSCGKAGGDCFDCTKNSTSATCDSGQCSGCDASSCTSIGQQCGTSSCGYNCGSCADSCSNGTVSHYTCSNKVCQANGTSGCGLFLGCGSDTTCATTCSNDADCASNAFCTGPGGTCKKKSGPGQSCTKEGGGDHECTTNVCSWDHSGKSGVCTSQRCTGCWAGFTDGTCTDYIETGNDPRAACQGYPQTACHQHWCAGNQNVPCNDCSVFQAQCDVGKDINGNPNPCGPITCSQLAGGTGTISGSLCIDGACKANQTNRCSDLSGYYCLTCNSNGCGTQTTSCN
jgi:hypothetical protein